MILLIDNYDSFTYNLVHFLGELGAATRVVRNDHMTVAEAMALNPSGIVLSPGACGPDEAGICVDLARAAAGHIPVLGVCLGHQAVGAAYGARISRGPAPMHGKVTTIAHEGTGLFAGLPSPLSATRYHSLVIRDDGLPADLAVTARSEDGVIMGLADTRRQVYGLQFHPESIATEHGQALLRNFLTHVQAKDAAA